MKISYAITTHNETTELERLLGFLSRRKDAEDEIVILDDYSTNLATGDIIERYSYIIGAKTWKYEQRKLDMDFASQKNYLTRMCTGDYIFNIDADEVPHETLMAQLKQILEINDTELIWVPRVNTVEGLTQDHIQKWGWRVSDKGWVNYPDYQARIYKNVEHIRWVKPVHEVIEGAQTYSHLPPHEELSLYHHKKIDKQEQQNEFYAKIN
jgi:glycosyltransferase involved in cell wall biosynthesis